MHCDENFGIYPWFHGLLGRRDADELLEGTDDGTYMLRVCQMYKGYALSVRTPVRMRHYKLYLTDDVGF